MVNIAFCFCILTTVVSIPTDITSSSVSPSPPKDEIDTSDYRQVLRLSLLFYRAQRSGYLPEDNGIPWRGNSALNDVGQKGEDLTGGYYDGENGKSEENIPKYLLMLNVILSASDFVKFSFTMAFTTTLLAWGVLSYRDAYEKAGDERRRILLEGVSLSFVAFFPAGQYEDVLEAIKWASDYFIKCHTNRYEFYGQVGDFSSDHKFWGRPEDLNMSRPAYKIDEDHPGKERHLNI